MKCVSSCKVIYLVGISSFIVTVTVLHASRSKEKCTTLQHEQRSPCVFVKTAQHLHCSKASNAVLLLTWSRGLRGGGGSPSVTLTHAIW